jgi:hypothetical protein
MEIEQGRPYCRRRQGCNPVTKPTDTFPSKQSVDALQQNPPSAVHMTNAQGKLNLGEPPSYANSGASAADIDLVCSPRTTSRKSVKAKDQAVRITTYHSWAQLEEIIPAWENILKKNPALSIFSTPDWLGSWWKAFGSNRQMLTLAFWNETGELVGLAPFYLDDSRFLLVGRLKCLRLVGDGSADSDHLELIVQTGFEEACGQALLRWLTDHPTWDFCCLNTLPENSATARVLLRQLDEANWPLMLESCPNAAVHLPESWQSYVKSLAHHFRPLVTRYPRRLANRYEVRIYRCEDLAEIPAGLEKLFSLHQKRWNRAKQPGSFGSRARRNFYLDMAQAFLRRGWLELWFLELNGAVVAAQFCFRYLDNAYILQEGFDPDFTADKVGYAATIFSEVLTATNKTGERSPVVT